MKPIALTLLLSVIFVFSGVGSAKESELSLAMKNLAFEYKTALKAQSIDSFRQSLDKVKNQVTVIKGIGFKNHREESRKGMEKVALVLQDAEAAIAQGNLIKAQKSLKSLDTLRKRYHKLHEPSFWQLLFG